MLLKEGNICKEIIKLKVLQNKCKFVKRTAETLNTNFRVTLNYLAKIKNIMIIAV